MTLSLPPVHAALRPFIKGHHLMELQETTYFIRMVPASTRCVLIIPYGDALCILLKNQSYYVDKPFLLGLTT